MSRRLEILKNSLQKKEELFSAKLDNHIATVKQANGQPLNDKRNGAATLAKWDRQNEALRNIKKGIEATKAAIEREEWKVRGVENTKKELPEQILKLIDSGELIQWRKHPNFFFVPGVDKARIVWDSKAKQVAHRYATQVKDQEQYTKFRDLYNSLHKAIANS